MRNYPGFREETEIDGILILHLFQTHGQLTLLCHSTHRREVVDSLETFELVEFVRWNRYIVPNDVNVSLSGKFILCEFFFFFFWHLLLAVTFFGFLVVLRVISVFLFLSGNDFPLHLERHLSENFVLCVSQINPNLASIENITTAGSGFILICFLRWRLRLRLHFIRDSLIQLDDGRLIRLSSTSLVL